jgi:hypothetical protein
MRVFAFSLIGLIACSTPTGSQTLEQQEKRSASDKVLNAIDKLLTLTEQMGKRKRYSASRQSQTKLSATALLKNFPLQSTL